MLWWSGDLIEAYVRYGLPDEARRVLARLEQSVASKPIASAAAVAARSRALLEPKNAVEHLERALAWHAKARMPFEQARTSESWLPSPPQPAADRGPIPTSEPRWQSLNVSARSSGPPEREPS